MNCFLLTSAAVEYYLGSAVLRASLNSLSGGSSMCKGKILQAGALPLPGGISHSTLTRPPSKRNMLLVMKKRLITSALPYVNNIPHLGNLIQVL
ncbi:MAG: hypothetical protein DRP60_10280, partial [Spirochaetes bacterium]